MRVLIHGCGYTGEAWLRRLVAEGVEVCATSRTPARRAALARLGAHALDPNDGGALTLAAAGADGVLVSAPPDVHGCPGLRAMASVLAAASPRWIGYLSTTGVYGDRGGRWVDERSPLQARTPEAARRVAAEAGWRALAETHGLPLVVFRLPGIYGPGRSPLDRVREGRAQRLDKPGQVFSRIHVDDLAAALGLSLRRPGAGALFNLCDDEPAAAEAVTACAAHLLGRPVPPLRPFEAAALPPAALRFWGESKRVSNARAKAALGWRPAYPTYAEGLAAVLTAEAASQSSSAA